MNVDYATRESLTIRQPATAHLMIDSDDRDFQSANLFTTSPWDFQLTRTQNLQVGFFTRVSATELVLDWEIPNISPSWNNHVLIFDVSSNDISGAKSITLSEGFYTSKKALDCVVEKMNTEVGSAVFSVIQDCSGVGIDISGAREFSVLGSLPLAGQLGFPIGGGGPGTYKKTFYLVPDLRTIKYIDFICDNLTYNQKVKDTNTTPITKNVLARYYFSWDDQNDLDAYGLPIYQSYTPFVSRKLFSPPKYITFDPQIPVGNLKFEVWARFSPYFYATAPLLQGYAPLALVYPPSTLANLATEVSDTSSWMMTLQLSEN